MADIVNLNKARKALGLAVAEALAAANRRKFGRSKAEKQTDKASETKRNTLLDGAKLK